jgi:hypothetical protein
MRSFAKKARLCIMAGFAAHLWLRGEVAFSASR